MKLILLFSLFFSHSVYADGSVDSRLMSREGSSTICYFSLNNNNEKEVLKKFTNDISKNRSPIWKVETREFMGDSSEGGTSRNPEKRFIDMIKKMKSEGKKCNGLVISGHHVGEFGGKNADGQLGIGFLEKLACNKEYQEFFDGVGALWLHGCRTLGEKIIGDNGRGGLSYNSERLDTELREVDSLEMSERRLQTSLTAVLDEENPYGSRYLRIFSKANIYGWNNTSPGEDSASAVNIPNHIAHMAGIHKPPQISRESLISMGIRIQSEEDKEKNYTDTVFKYDDETALKYSIALTLMLNNNQEVFTEFTGCDPSQLRSRMLEAWRKQSNANCTDRMGQLCVQNDSSTYLESLSPEEAAKQKSIRSLGCSYNNATTDIEKEQIIKQIMEDPDALIVNYNIIQDAFMSAEKGSSLHNLISSSEELKSFLKLKLENDNVSLILKMDYLKFLTRLEKDASKLTEYLNNIINLTVKRLSKKDENIDDRTFNYELISRLIQLDSKLLDKVISHEKFDSKVLDMMSLVVSNRRDDISRAYFSKIISLENTAPYSLKEAYYALRGESDIKIKAQLMKKIVTHNSNTEIINEKIVSDLIKTPTSEYVSVFRDIAVGKNINDDMILSMARYLSKLETSNESKELLEILKDKSKSRLNTLTIERELRKY